MENIRLRLGPDIQLLKLKWLRTKFDKSRTRRSRARGPGAPPGSAGLDQQPRRADARNVPSSSSFTTLSCGSAAGGQGKNLLPDGGLSLAAGCLS